MKNLTLLYLLFLLNIYNVNAQDFSLFAVDQTIWSIGVFSDNPNEEDYVYFLKIDGQVYIDDTWYFQIKKSENFTSMPDDWELDCYVRVDEDSILYLRTIDNIEKKIFNYKLGSGDIDECWLYDYFAEEFLVVNIKIQEITNIINSTYTYKKWTVINEQGADFPYTTWIENIGCMEGILKANRGLNPLTGHTDVVLCAWLDGSQIYSNENYENCGLVATQDIIYEEFTIHPNPAKDKITILSTNDIFNEITIFNSEGLIIKQIKLNGTSQADILVSDLTSGKYLLKIAYKNSSHFVTIVKI